MRKSDATKIAGHLAKDTPQAVGDCGVLLETSCDMILLNFLRLMAGLPFFGEPGSDFAWSRDKIQAEVLSLDARPFGIRISAPTPELLAQGLEHLAEITDQALVSMCANPETQFDPIDPAHRIELQRQMRRRFAMTPPDVPLGVSTTLDPDAPDLIQDIAPSEIWEVRTSVDATEERREYSRDPDVEDHRPIIPVKEHDKPKS